MQPSHNPASLDRPIFVVGHARGGSTLLGAILNWHPQVGPRPFADSYPDVNAFISSMLHHDTHLDYSERLEQKDTWFRFFPGREVFTHMGRELVVETAGLDDRQQQELRAQLTHDFTQQRFLSKAPSNAFRVAILPQLFPGAKILAIYRSAPEVVSSWGQRAYGFGKRVSWGNTRYRRLGFRRGIKIFARKWQETILYLEQQRARQGFLAITYDDLLDHTVPTLKRVCAYLELPWQDYLGTVRLHDNRDAWRRQIPVRYHRYLHRKTAEGMRLYETIRTA